MCNYKLSELFSSKDFRTIDKSGRDNPINKSKYIPIEIELLEGSRLYDAFPAFFSGDPVIYGYITENATLNSHFTLTPENKYGNRYIIIRESTLHMLLIFVSDDEEKMNFLRFEKDDFFDLANKALHPNM